MPNNVPRALRHSGALDPGWTAQAFYHVYGCGMGSGSLIRADELLPARRHAGGRYSRNQMPKGSRRVSAVNVLPPWHPRKSENRDGRAQLFPTIHWVIIRRRLRRTSCGFFTKEIRFVDVSFAGASNWTPRMSCLSNACVTTRRSTVSRASQAGFEARRTRYHFRRYRPHVGLPSVRSPQSAGQQQDRRL